MLSRAKLSIRHSALPFIAVLLLTCSVLAQVPVTTYHNDTARTGQNTSETTLTTSNVNSGQFGKLFSLPVDGYVYAQPLYVPNLTVGGTPHNVLFVVTEHDSAYAFDADTSGAALWHVSFINPASGITTVDSNNDAGCGDLVPEIGITSTPVIDLATNTMYLTAKTKENGIFHLRLHALDITSGAEKFGGPVDIQGTYTVGQTTITYSPLLEAQRAGLLLQNNKVYIATASHCDNGPYHGWVFEYSVGTSPMTQHSRWVADPTGSDGGIWMAGDGPAGDASGNVYVATGNGSWDGTNNYGDSIVRLSTTSGLALSDYFTPYDQTSLNSADADLGSGGVLLLPSTAGSTAHPNLLLESGKEGTIYLLDVTGGSGHSMGHFHSGNDSQIVQSVQGQIQGTWSTPAYWNGSVYFGGSGQGPSDTVKAFSVGNGLLSSTPTSHSSTVYHFPGPTVSISSNGNSNGIAWALQNEGYLSNTAAILHAYDATNLGTELYNSNQNAARDGLGLPVKFSVPTVANGKVYVGTQAAVSVFGIVSALPQAAAPGISPYGGTFTSPVTLSLSTTVPGGVIYFTTNGTTPTLSSTKYAGKPMTFYSTVVIKAIVSAPGYNASPVSFATFTIVQPSSTINESTGFNSSGLTLNGSAALVGTRLRLTDGGTNEASSAFATAPINVQAFITDFNFQLTSASADGFTFVFQGSGANAIGASGGGLGYGPDPCCGATSPKIAKSVAIKFDLYDNAGEGPNSIGMFVSGTTPTTPAIDLTPSGLDLHSGDLLNAHFIYDGTRLTLILTDLQSGKSYGTAWRINIPAYVGGNTGWVGFTAGTGGLSAVQEILNWTYASSNLRVSPKPTVSPAGGKYFSSVQVTMTGYAGAAVYYTTDGSNPTTSSTPYTSPITITNTTTFNVMDVQSGYGPSFPSTYTYTVETPTINYGPGFSATGLQQNGSSGLNGTKLRLTNGGANQAGSAFVTTLQPDTGFTTEFTFQQTSASADGFAFVLQNNAATAIGSNGGALGYQGINHSIALKFDLYSNSGEGTNSVGLYANGAAPTTPAVDLTPSGISLHSGDTMFARITYSSNTLTLNLTDKVTSKTFTYSWTINVASTIGSTTAYAGFTGGTGGQTAIQDIISWQFGQ
ncbi:hypothetical protein Acid345_1484 [Candidatus Koribacter versatilis Ellin345]|uniref:Legume lectin domain-containing protein n=1 Tax=Koribacter versatilis (strain Ellin345) TaxID=204669 RepID=Q1IRL4_KORVE|nr:chitobiase/beta-hexosaminidase C-terminal domain-containing protein [Candidatus Koribacter versatilis]ABF40486.1 hypothetical protein Acid345_1484 [Candidatus Koribacter versatilis Ellin345]